MIKPKKFTEEEGRNIVASFCLMRKLNNNIREKKSTSELLEVFDSRELMKICILNTNQRQ